MRCIPQWKGHVLGLLKRGDIFEGTMREVLRLGFRAIDNSLRN